MNSINEKEKKLNTALDELKNLDLSNPNLRNNIENLNSQKTQLEIECFENLNFQYYFLNQGYLDLNFLTLK